MTDNWYLLYGIGKTQIITQIIYSGRLGVKFQLNLFNWTSNSCSYFTIYPSPRYNADPVHKVAFSLCDRTP